MNIILVLKGPHSSFWNKLIIRCLKKPGLSLSLLLVLILLLVIFTTPVLAQGNTGKMPQNAHIMTYGIGWQCNHGYRQMKQDCISIKLPANAYLSAKGHQWKCKRGYRKNGDTCAAILVPKNAYLEEVSYGPGWRCDRGYRAVRKACVAVKVPVNAHLDSLGNDWKCNEPYLKKKDQCISP